MQAVLYIAHGSRLREAIEQVDAFMKKSMVEIKVPIQEYCFLEWARPTLQDGVVTCIKRGATKIAVIPFLLLLAGHAKHDIPRELKRLQAQFPQIEIRYGQPLGVHNAIIDIIVERMLEKQKKVAHDAQILLVGRGGSDPEIPYFFQEIVTFLQQKITNSHIKTAFLAACEPDFETGLKTMVRTGASQVYVVPYLLFTGKLLQRMERRLKELKAPGQTFILCDPLGYHRNLVHVLSKRVQEIV